LFDVVDDVSGMSLILSNVVPIGLLSYVVTDGWEIMFSFINVSSVNKWGGVFGMMAESFECVLE
jgi:hypothetical protein